jgi:enamine deaminase RidA (YjgF/YER057c/UK114 family)
VTEVPAVVRLGSSGPYEDAVGYSRVVAVGDHAWTAGCTAIVDGELVGVGDAFVQAVAALELAVASLGRAGFGPTTVVHARMYVVDIAAHAEAVGRAHARVLGATRPAATMLGVSALVDPRMLVEVELVGGEADVLQRLGVLLEAAGAKPMPGRPKLFRALGLEALVEPPLLDASAPTSDHIRAMMRAQFEAIRQDSQPSR